MKKLLIFALFLGLHTAAMAQESNGLEKNKAVYLELLGPSNLAGTHVSTTTHALVGERV